MLMAAGLGKRDVEGTDKVPAETYPVPGAILFLEAL